jgi:hypothetical protein
MIIPDKKKAATVIVAHMMDPHHPEEEENGEDEECSALGHEVIQALAAKDPMAVYEALKAVFLKVDSEPHLEGEHEEEEEEEEEY